MAMHLHMVIDYVPPKVLVFIIDQADHLLIILPANYWLAYSSIFYPSNILPLIYSIIIICTYIADST